MTDKCSNCDQMRKESTLHRKALIDTNKQYVTLVNENLALRRKLEEFGIYYHGDLNANTNDLKVI